MCCIPLSLLNLVFDPYGWFLRNFWTRIRRLPQPFRIIAPNQSKSCFLSAPGHNTRNNEKSDRQNWTSADNEKLCQNHADHHWNSKNSDDSGETRDQEQYPRRDLDEPNHITKPLANADGSERFNHLFIARQLGKPCQEEQHRSENLNNPKRSVSRCFQACRICRHKKLASFSSF